MERAKLIATLALVLAGIIVVFQNTQPVETKFLFMSVTMPIAALLALAMLVGMAVGILVAFGLSNRKPKKPENGHRPGH